MFADLEERATEAEPRKRQRRIDAGRNDETNVRGKAVDQHPHEPVGLGLLVLLGVGEGDDAEIAAWMADKVCGLRIFADEEGRMNRSLDQVDGGLLVVSQFTLYGDVSRGRRPSFVGAADPDVAEELYEEFVAECRRRTDRVETGVFGEMMEVEMVNDGPVTILVEREP